jgi:hypothetical protein
MSRIAIPAIEAATGATGDVYAQVKKIAGGRVPNTYAALGYLTPAPMSIFRQWSSRVAHFAPRHDADEIELIVYPDPSFHPQESP